MKLRPLVVRFGALLLLGVVTLSSSAQGPLPKVDSTEFSKTPYVLSNGVRGEIVQFPSNNPADYGPAMRGDLGKPVSLNGQLFLPANANGSVPAVVETPGSGNLGPHHMWHAATLTSAGIAVLLIDPFYARNINNTIADQSQVSFAASAYDVIAAAKYLRSRKEVDGKRIGATGGSRGGTAVMMAAAAPFSDALLGPGHGLRAVVAGYPWCGVQFRSARLAFGASMLILSGDRDDWVSFLQCQDAAHAMELTGQDVVMKLFPGALHAFDREGVPRTSIPEAVTSTVFPTIYMNDAGQFYNMRTGAVDPTVTAQQLTAYSVKGGFLHKGTTIGSEGNQAAEYSDEMLSFFRAKLSPIQKQPGTHGLHKQ